LFSATEMVQRVLISIPTEQHGGGRGGGSSSHGRLWCWSTTGSTQCYLFFFLLDLVFYLMCLPGICINHMCALFKKQSLILSFVIFLGVCVKEPSEETPTQFPIRRAPKNHEQTTILM
jgi:hypothetical protein